MISIPDVTLVIAETRAHDLSRITVNDIISKINFGGGILIYTDDCERLAVPGARYIKVADWSNKIAAGSFYYTEAAREITTSHALLMEWDAGACKPDMWRDEFLQYDYIGAPWEWRVKQGTAVGNGGFALVTKRLVDFCHDNQFKIPTDMDISVHRRRELETRGGFKWAPENVARDFAYEGWTPRGSTVRTDRPNSFGYHSVCNWPYILDRADLLNRARILFKAPPVTQTAGMGGVGGGGNKINLLLRAAPWLRNELRGPLLPPQQLSHQHLMRQRAAIYQSRGGKA
jgi:hypothetical protein